MVLITTSFISPIQAHLRTDGRTFIDKIVTDIHILRGKENICPKQDLLFSLIDGDYVHFGFYGC